jgi:hypothetical protein
VTVSVSDGVNTGSTTVTINVTQEDARLNYTGPMLVFTPPGGSSATVSLKASVLDATAPPALDSDPGDISKATVTFKDITNPLSPITLCSNVAVVLDSPGDTKVGTASCTATLNGLDDHVIGMYVNNSYYLGSTQVVVEVAQPDGNFITGGGYLKMSDSFGTYAATPGSNMNFGFNVKYTKGTNPQPKGHLNIIVRSGGHVYQIKSTSITLLSLGYTGTCPTTPTPSSTCFGVATFESKANLTDVTNPLAPISLPGNNRLVVSMTDKGEPGSADTFAVTLYQGQTSSTVWFSSSWTGTRTVEKLLAGGNLVVH